MGHHRMVDTLTYSTPSSCPAEHTLSPSMAAHTVPAASVVPVQVRTPVAYKRPLPMTRKVLGTPTMALSPRATPTPPHKIIVGPGQRLMPKQLVREYEYSDYQEHHQRELATPLTPPATPEVTSLRG